MIRRYIVKRLIAVLAVIALTASFGFANGTQEKAAKKLTIAGIVFQTDQFFRIVEGGYLLHSSTTIYCGCGFCGFGRV